MGSLSLPVGADIYLDANCIIYSGERIAPYHSLLKPVWQAARNGKCSIVTSELSLLEVLVGPIKNGDTALEDDFRRLLLQSSDVRLLEVDRSILLRAAHVRADTRVKTPDAMHAATALEAGCGLFLTNDPAFQRVAGLPVTVLSDLLTP